MLKEINEYKEIENEFFELDKANKIALIKLHFNKPSEVFDTNALTKTPVLSDDFMDWILSSFKYAPKNYKLHLDVSFEDYEEYDEKKLEEIFVKNLILEVKKQNREFSLKKKIAISLLITGVLLLISMIILLNVLKEDNLLKQVFQYVFDIGTTVVIWEALTILLVENSESKSKRAALIKKFSKITFSKSHVE